MKRILRATFTIAANAASDTDLAVVTQADLDAAVPQGGGIIPLALIFDPEDADITCEGLVAMNAKNTENQANIIPAGSSGLSLGAVNKATQPQAGGIEAPFYPTSLGFQLSGVFSNADSNPKTVEVLIVVENQGNDEKAGMVNIRESQGKEKAFVDSGGRSGGPTGGGMKDTKSKELGGG